MNDKEKLEHDAEVFVKGVKRRTRKKFTAEETQPSSGHFDGHIRSITGN